MKLKVNFLAAGLIPSNLNSLAWGNEQKQLFMAINVCYFNKIIIINRRFNINNLINNVNIQVVAILQVVLFLRLQTPITTVT